MQSSNNYPISPPGGASVSYPMMQANGSKHWLVMLRDMANLVLMFGSATYGLLYIWKVSEIMDHENCPIISHKKCTVVVGLTKPSW